MCDFLPCTWQARANPRRRRAPPRYHPPCSPTGPGTDPVAPARSALAASVSAKKRRATSPASSTNWSGQWTQQAAPRRFRRFASSGAARMALGFDAMHYFVSGQEFVQPEVARTYSRGEFDTLFTFRDRINPQAPCRYASRSISPPTTGRSSITGQRLPPDPQRGRTKNRPRSAHRGLPHDGDHFIPSATPAG